jgi:hypothetical protein
MGKATANFAFDHTTDAGFRVWGLAVSTMLQATGLVKTSDTGQVDWTTVTKPGAGALGGYEIYRFDDALQATAPIFIRLEYKSASASATRPALWMQVGVATNGAGTMVGTTSTLLDVTTNPNTPSTSTIYSSFACAKDGYLGACIGAGATNNQFFLGVERFRDAAGVMLAEGVAIYNMATAGTYRTQAPALWGPTTYYCFVPGNKTVAAVGTELQVFRHYWIPVERVRCTIGFCTHMQTEISALSEFSVALITGDSHTYLALSQFANTASVSASTSHCQAMRYEA